MQFNLNLGSRVVDAALAMSAGISGRALSGGLSTGSQYSFSAIYLDQISASGHVLSRQYVPVIGGRYEAVDILPGTHLFAARTAQPYENFRRQLFSGIDCPVSLVYNPDYADCMPAPVAPISLISGESNNTVDFYFTPHRSRLVRAVDDATGQPLADVVIDIWALDGTWLNSARTKPNGIYAVGQNSSIGQEPYAVKLSTDNGLGYLNEVYYDHDCAPGSSAFLGTCSLAGAAAVLVSDPSQTLFPMIEFRLRSADPLFKSDFE